MVTGELPWHDKEVVDPLPTKVETLGGGRTERGGAGSGVMSSRQPTPERSTGWEWSPCWLVVRKRKPGLRERGVGRANLIGHHNSNFTVYQKSKAATHYSCPMAAIINFANSVASKIN